MHSQIHIKKLYYSPLPPCQRSEGIRHCKSQTKWSLVVEFPFFGYSRFFTACDPCACVDFSSSASSSVCTSRAPLRWLLHDLAAGEGSSSVWSARVDSQSERTFRSEGVGGGVGEEVVVENSARSKACKKEMRNLLLNLIRTCGFQSRTESMLHLSGCQLVHQSAPVLSLPLSSPSASHSCPARLLLAAQNGGMHTNFWLWADVIYFYGKYKVYY